VIAFRSRPSGTPPIFQMWRKLFIVDRAPPVMQLAAPVAGTPITSGAYTFAAKCPDRTAGSVSIFLDQPAGTDVIALARQGQGVATQTDRDRFERSISGLTAGNHRVDVVAIEETGRAGRTTFVGVPVVLNGFDGLGDMNGDGKITNRDIFPFVAMVQAGGQFNPSGDLNGDGVVDQNDVSLFANKLRGAGVPQAMVDQMIRPARRDSSKQNGAPERKGERNG
jgi:hypothetical protein